MYPQDDSPSDYVYALSDFDFDGVPDLFAIKTLNCGTGTIEVHIASGGANYQTSILDVGTPWAEVPNQTTSTFTLADVDGDGIPDLVQISAVNTGSGRVEIHVLSGASHYQTHIRDVATAEAQVTDTNRYQFLLKDFDRDGNPDLVTILKSQTGSGRTELHILSAASNYQSSLLDVATPFGPTGVNVSFSMLDVDGDSLPDLICVALYATGSNHVEITAVSAASNFSVVVKGVATGMPVAANTSDYVPLIQIISVAPKPGGTAMANPTGPAGSGGPPDQTPGDPIQQEVYDSGPFPCSVGVGEGASTANCDLLVYAVPNPTPKNPARPDPMAVLRTDAKGLKAKVDSKTISDCEALAEFASAAAQAFVSSPDSFAFAFSMLTPNTVLVKALHGVSGSAPYITLNQHQTPSGFLPIYQDEVPNADQGHHFAAYFQLGYKWSARTGEQAAGLFESLEGTSSNQGDINLGTEASLLGAQVKNGSLKVSNVANAIRADICKP